MKPNFLLITILITFLHNLHKVNSQSDFEEDSPLDARKTAWKETGKLWKENEYDGGIEYDYQESYTERSLNEGGIFSIYWC